MGVGGRVLDRRCHVQAPITAGYFLEGFASMSVIHLTSDCDLVVWWGRGSGVTRISGKRTLKRFSLASTGRGDYLCNTTHGQGRF